MAGVLELQNARVRWFLSIDADDLPQHCRDAGRHAFRSMTIDGQETEFSQGFTDLHTEVYRRTIAGRGLGITEARPGIELVYGISRDRVVSAGEDAHPQVERALKKEPLPDKLAA